VRRSLLFVLVLGVAVLVRPPEVAGACTCTDPGVDALAEQADVVLVGTVVDQEEGDADSVADAVRNTVEVERVYVGEAEPEVVVFGGVASSGSCEYGFEEGRYLIFGQVDGAGIHTDVCAGTRSLAADAEVPPQLGAGAVPQWAPIGGPDGDVEPEDRTEVVLLTGLLGAVAVGTAVALALAVRRRQRRRRASPG